eukprot:CAMPEP_0178931530 /NCGR_PEP_ID=MMETSP0786-20121207/21972_1 /TAXON_ID=186022 /ORGANISM="Thalassionema frauenfeldii, Strain CCMP 1798" /LENGTH=725 /DNA_ID=CAMNT_0020608439 /DNA_START=236 /DNA_END=2413 /DNA_ORIENTATION=+
METSVDGKKSYRRNDLEKGDEILSELDARVLQSMLQDGTVEVGTEESLNKLLERATTKYTKRVRDETDSEFNSRILQTVTDTKLWKGLSAKADDFVESALIYVVNRAQRDSALLASIGIFTLERMKRDIARALPVAGSTGAAVGRAFQTTARQLGSSSSFQDVKQAIKKGAESIAEEKEERKLEDVENLYDELNTPLDEIKSVTQSIKKILAGEKSETSFERGLRSAAPAGTKKRTERQQRAYQKRKQTVLKEEREGINVGKISGSVVDVAWEVKRDLQTETNRPGYKTERVRNAIAAGAETTSRVITAAREGDKVSLSNILFGSKDKKEGESVYELDAFDSVKEASVPSYDASGYGDEIDIPEVPEVPPVPSLVIPDVPLPAELLDEQSSVVARLQSCIEGPESTWLTSDVLQGSSEELDPDSLGEVVTTMICARDDLKVVSEVKSIAALSSQLKQVKNTVDFVVSVANSTACTSVSSKLNNILYGADPDDEIFPTLLVIEDIKASYLQEVENTKVAAQAKYEAALAERERLLDEREKIIAKREEMIKAKAALEKSKQDRLEAEIAEAERIAAEQAAIKASGKNDSKVEVIVDASPVDVSFEKVTEFAVSQSDTSAGFEVVLEEEDLPNSVAEVVIDTEFAGCNETVRILEDEEEEKPNLLIEFTLRSFDVAFVVFEKVVLAGLPNMLKVAGVASQRIDDASRRGLGRIGWMRLTNTEKGSKRY